MFAPLMRHPSSESGSKRKGQLARVRRRKSEKEGNGAGLGGERGGGKSLQHPVFPGGLPSKY